jgi:hypothetical protein
VVAEKRALLSEAFAQLPSDTRETLTLFYREGQSIAQVAALLEVSEVAIKKRLSRARKSLRHGVLEQLGETLSASAPGAAFAMSVTAALSLAAPRAATAMTVSASKAASSSAGVLGVALTWLLKAIAAVALTSAFGVIAAAFGARAMRRVARDDREKQQLLWIWLAVAGTFLSSSIGFEVRARTLQNHWLDVFIYDFFTLALLGLYFLWLPRIVRRRFEAEMHEDPARATAARRRDRMGKIIGWGLGLGVSWPLLILKHLHLWLWAQR